LRTEPQCEAVFDCNIYLQAAARPFSPSAACLRLAEEGVVVLYVSEDILTEVSEVLRRPAIQKRFPELTEESIYKFLERVRGFAKLIKKVPSKFSYQRDVDDEIYINLAVEAEADFLVSRDNDLLDLMTDYTNDAKDFRRRFHWLKVVDPVEFLNEVRKLESETDLS